MRFIDLRTSLGHRKCEVLTIRVVGGFLHKKGNTSCWRHRTGFLILGAPHRSFAPLTVSFIEDKICREDSNA